MSIQANLDKQIKRHITGRRHHFFSTAIPGLEAVCQAQIQALGQGVALDGEAKGGIGFSGRLVDLYRANLLVRTSGRILLRIGSFRATNFEQLERNIAAVAWARYLPWGALPACRVTARRSRLYHSDAVAERTLGVIGRYWHTLGGVAAPCTGQTVFVRLENDQVTLSLDSSGANLYQRGLKSHVARAPLRETLAAAILVHAGYRPDRPLIDPMCGAGTFALEAALMAKQIPPGAYREFAFMQWPAFRPPQWEYLKRAAVREKTCLTRPMILASDIDADACRTLSACVARHALGDAVQVRCRDFFSVQPHMDFSGVAPGVVVLNPPYGRRLGSDRNLKRFYGRIGERLTQAFKGWRVAVIVPQPELINLLPDGLTRLAIVHGGLPLTLVTGKIR